MHYTLYTTHDYITCALHYASRYYHKQTRRVISHHIPPHYTLCLTLPIPDWTIRQHASHPNTINYPDCTIPPTSCEMTLYSIALQRYIAPCETYSSIVYRNALHYTLQPYQTIIRLEQNILKYTRIYQNILEYTRIYQNILEQSRV